MSVAPREDPPDRALLQRCKAQDPLAFRAFIGRHERIVFALLSRMLGRGAEVEDLLRPRRKREGCDLAAHDASLEDTDETSTGSNPEISLERRQLGRAIAAAAKRLPDDQRAALLLADFHGLSTAEIATALGVNESTAKTRPFRAREKMREALKDEWRTS